MRINASIRLLLVVFCQFFSHQLFGQKRILFKEPLKLVAKEKVSPEIPKGTIILALGVEVVYGDGYATYNIITSNSEKKLLSFLPSKVELFEFHDIDTISKVWDRILMAGETYASLLLRGYQYDLRSELNNEAIDFINTLSVNDRFYDDKYFEDYLYTLVSKIHNGILWDNRPGNIYVKILKDPEPNAFSLPNGCVVVSTGLLSTVQSEDELVGVLAHEIAHFVLDHQVLNYSKEIDRKKRAEFWASFATLVAASADVYISVNNNSYLPGALTASTSIIASVVSDEVVKRLGIKYSQEQEAEADNVAQEVLSVLKYNKLALSATLQRIKYYYTITGNHLGLSGGGTHPSLDSRIGQLGSVKSLDTFVQALYLKRVSFINSYNAWIELWYYAHHLAAHDLASRNIDNSVATESDYVVKAVVKRRMSNSLESNLEVIDLLNKAKLLNVIPSIYISKEEGITYMRLGKSGEAKKSFQLYLTGLNEYKQKEIQSNDKMRIQFVDNEILWTQKMIFKVDKL